MINPDIQQKVNTLLNDRTRPVHLIGGGGVGMSGLGLMLLNLGFQVSASDKNDSTYLKKLEKAGATIWVGSSAENIPENAVTFFSTAIPEHDLERAFLVEHEWPVFNRHPLLAFLSQSTYTIAVSGTHGKTTTSAMIAFMLQQAGLEPSALIGGTVAAWQSNTVISSGEFNGRPLLVIEADESDSSFLNIETQIAVITNIDMDHPDHYHSFEQVKDNFYKFAENCASAGGRIITSIETDHFFKTSDQAYRQPEIDLLLDNEMLLVNGKKLVMSIPGRHNLLNATAAIRVAAIMGLDLDQSIKSISEFTGVERRMQLLHSSEHFDVIDDYAHHPEEIKAVLSTIEKKYEHIIAVWEPHRISRLTHFAEEYIETFKSMKYLDLFLMPVFAASDVIADFEDFYRVIGQLHEIATGEITTGDYEPVKIILAEKTRSQTKTCVIFMGAGHSSSAAHEFCRMNTQ